MYNFNEELLDIAERAGGDLSSVTRIISTAESFQGARAIGLRRAR